MAFKDFPTINDLSGRMFGSEEMELLQEVIQSGCLFRYCGNMVVQLEKEFSTAIGTRHAIACSSGTASLHAAVAALELEPGEEIITTPITDMGTVIAILMQQCIPIFADVDPRTGNITAQTIQDQITEKTRAVIVVHLFGQPADINPIAELTKNKGLYLIEDAAQAYFAEYHGQKVGTFGDIGCFSLQQSKQISSGDGGLIVTNHQEFAERVSLFCDKGWPRSGPDAVRGHVSLAVNYRMNELTGAVALAQIRKLPEIMRRRRGAADEVIKHLQTVKGVNPPFLIPKVNCAWWKFWMTLDVEKENASEKKKRFAEVFEDAGISMAVGYIPMMIFEYPVIAKRRTFGKSELPWSLPQARRDIKYCREDYPGAAQYLETVLHIGWHEKIGHEEIKRIKETLNKASKELDV